MYYQLNLINNAKAGVRSDNADIIIKRIMSDWDEYFDWVDDDDEESNRRLAINTCLQGISEWSESAADITYCIVSDTSIMDATISLTEDQHSLIWYVLKSLSNERAGIEDYDFLMEHADTKVINNVLQSFMEKVGQWNGNGAEL